MTNPTREQVLEAIADCCPLVDFESSKVNSDKGEADVISPHTAAAMFVTNAVSNPDDDANRTVQALFQQSGSPADYTDLLDRCRQLDRAAIATLVATIAAALREAIEQAFLKKEGESEN